MLSTPFESAHSLQSRRHFKKEQLERLASRNLPLSSPSVIIKVIAHSLQTPHIGVDGLASVAQTTLLRPDSREEFSDRHRWARLRGCREDWSCDSSAFQRLSKSCLRRSHRLENPTRQSNPDEKTEPFVGVTPRTNTSTGHKCVLTWGKQTPLSDIHTEWVRPLWNAC